MSTRYWLSIAIPAYNCSSTIERLLDSILIQDTDNVEIIICDDQSIDNFMKKVYPYMDKLNIKYCKTKKRKIQCPSNTRIDGMKYATGKYITFIDSDDMFHKDAFSIIKNITINWPDYKVIYSNILLYFEKENKYVSMKNTDSNVYIHGKFFNRDWLLENNIEFKENLYITEDLYFNGLVNFNLIGQNINNLLINAPTCIHIIGNEESFTNTIIKNNENIYEKYFEDYCIASLDCVLSCINKYPNSFNIYKFYIYRVFIYLYMHIQLFIFKSGFNNNYDTHKLIIQRYLEKVLQINIFIDNILDYAYNNPEDYDKIKHEVEDSNKCKFIESDSFFNFMLKLMN